MSYLRVLTKHKFIVACLTVVFFLLGCSTVAEDGQIVAPPSSNVVQNPQFIKKLANDGIKQPEPTLIAQLNIGPDGGYVSDGFASLTFPENALDTDVTVTIEAVDSDLLIVDLAPEGIHFNVPVTFNFHLAGTSHEGLASECSVVWFNAETGQWELLPTMPLGPDVISVQLHHFSKYGGLPN